MFGLPKSTEINKQLPKKAVFDKFKPNATKRKLFDEQINRMSIVAEISPQTVSITADEKVSSIYVILMTLKVPECNKKNIILLSKLINQHMVFALQFENSVRLAVYRAEQVLISENKPIEEWQLSLPGLDLGAVWENIIAEVGGIDLTGGKDLDTAVAANARREKLTKQITALEKKAWAEKQPKKKFELVQQIKALMSELEE